MKEMETYLKDLNAQNARIKLERGLKITKAHILEFIAELVKGDTIDKDFHDSPFLLRRYIFKNPCSKQFGITKFFSPTEKDTRIYFRALSMFTIFPFPNFA